ncbi:hypothetical protein D3C86_1534860 [compost metagenome]
MHRYPATAPYAHGTDFTRLIVISIQPYTCKTRIPPGFDTKIGERQNNRFFKRTQIKVYVSEEIVQIKNGVAYYLSRAMIGNVAAPVNFIIRSFFIRQALLIQ